MKSPLFLQVDKYKLSYHDKKNFWLSNVDGEGMNVPYKKLVEFLDKYFEENF